MENIAQQVLASNTYEVVINSTAVTKFTLPDDAILRGKTIVGVAVRSQSTLSGVTSKSASARTLVSNNALASGFLSLLQNSTAIIQECPLNFFVPDFRAGWYAPVRIEDFSPSTSYVRFADASLLTVNQCVEITFYYEP